MTTTTTTKKYELTIIMDETATQEAIDELTGKIKRYGEITSIEDWGTKRLAYPINDHEKDHEKARFLYYTLELENDAPAKLSSSLYIDDNAIRYLLVRASK